MERIVIGLSGGVDSSVAAYLLKKQGYEVIGVYMINWKETVGTLSGECPWEDDLLVAELVARKLDIEFHSVDLSEKYSSLVVDYMFSEYQKGRTPNPDVLCNREIKFDAFIEAAKMYGADKVATGHYCRADSINIVKNHELNENSSKSVSDSDSDNLLNENSSKPISDSDSDNLLNENSSKPVSDSDSDSLLNDNLLTLSDSSNSKVIYRLLAGKDPNKDQSYFLCQLNQEQLSKAVFPIGDIEKPEVRRIAAELGLASALKKDSQGICFVGKVDLPVFLQQKLEKKTGKVVEIPADLKAYNRMVPEEKLEALRKQSRPYYYRIKDGKVVGEHQGAHFYTIGQRKGLGIGGYEKPLFVIATDVKENFIFVGEGDNHPGLYRKTLKINNDEIHWIRTDKALKLGEEASYQVRIRYRQPLQNAVLHQLEDGLYIEFENPQQSVTAGQFAAWYKDDEVIGSGPISQ